MAPKIGFSYVITKIFGHFLWNVFGFLLVFLIIQFILYGVIHEFVSQYQGEF